MQLTSVCTTLNIYCSQVEARCCEKTKKDSGADRPQRVLCFGVFAFRNVERCIGISGLQDRFPACLMWRLCQRRTGRIIPAGWSSGCLIHLWSVVSGLLIQTPISRSRQRGACCWYGRRRESLPSHTCRLPVQRRRWAAGCRRHRGLLP